MTPKQLETLRDMLLDLEEFGGGGTVRSVEDVDKMCRPWFQQGCPMPTHITKEHKRLEGVGRAIVDARVMLDGAAKNGDDGLTLDTVSFILTAIEAEFNDHT